jgi:copper chaperone CopZ
MLSSFAAFSQTEEKIIEKGKVTEANFWVNGNCDMCKKRIEKALDISGVKLAEYNFEINMLFVAFRNDKYTLLQIHELIAAAGHDTRKAKALDSVYNELHHCCMYDRVQPESK